MVVEGRLVVEGIVVEGIVVVAWTVVVPSMVVVSGIVVTKIVVEDGIVEVDSMVVVCPLHVFSDNIKIKTHNNPLAFMLTYPANLPYYKAFTV